MITKDKVTEIFCIIDEFDKNLDMEMRKNLFLPSETTGVKRHRNRKGRLSRSEIMTIRGMNGSPFRDLDNITPNDVGKSYTVPNYFSTSPGGGEFKGKNHILHILVPKGKGLGAYVAPISEFPVEREFLLKRNGRYLIEQVEEVDGKKHVWLRMVG